MLVNKIKLIAIAIIALPMFAIAVFNENSVRAVSSADDDAVTTYKTKCAVCHTPKADKFFDATKTDDALVEVVLKGKKGEKPPFMPGFEAKGMTADQAKALVAHMKQLKTPAN